MPSIFLPVCSLGVLLLLFYFLTLERRIAKTSREMESLRLEQDKLNFRIFVAEKKQKLLQEKRIV